MRKYLKKQTVIYRFKLNILTEPDNAGASQLEKEELWLMYLLSLAEAGKITAKNAATWKYPHKELK